MSNTILGNSDAIDMVHGYLAGLLDISEVLTDFDGELPADMFPESYELREHGILSVNEFLADCATLDTASRKYIYDNPERAGHCLALSRNGHAGGFDDHQDALHEVARGMGTTHMFLDDNNEVDAEVLGMNNEMNLSETDTADMVDACRETLILSGTVYNSDDEAHAAGELVESANLRDHCIDVVDLFLQKCGALDTASRQYIYDNPEQSGRSLALSRNGRGAEFSDDGQDALQAVARNMRETHLFLDYYDEVDAEWRARL